MRKILIGWFIMFAAIAAHGKETLVVGTNATHPPFTFVDAKSHKIVGHDIDLVTKILTDLGYEVKIEDMRFDGLLPAVMSSKIDVVACLMTITPERAKNVLFTDIYFVGGSRIAVLSKNKTIHDFDDLKDKRVGVEIGTIQAIIARENAARIGEIVEFNSEEIFLALKSGKVDATIADEGIASYFFNISKVADAKFTGAVLNEKGKAFVVKKGNTKLAEQINKKLAELKKNGWYAKNYKKWIGSTPPKE
jgi:polar amino acid transport system substrate-binding protein